MIKETKQLEWSNLLDGFCPKCDGCIEEQGSQVKCDSCDFHISKARFDELTKKMKREQGDDSDE